MFAALESSTRRHVGPGATAESLELNECMPTTQYRTTIASPRQHGGYFEAIANSRVIHKRLVAEQPTHMRVSDAESVVKRLNSVSVLEQPNSARPATRMSKDGGGHESETSTVRMQTAQTKADVDIIDGYVHVSSIADRTGRPLSRLSTSRRPGSNASRLPFDEFSAAVVTMSPSVTVVKHADLQQQRSLSRRRSRSASRTRVASTTHAGIELGRTTLSSSTGTLARSDSLLVLRTDGTSQLVEVPALPRFLQPHMHDIEGRPTERALTLSSAQSRRTLGSLNRPFSSTSHSKKVMPLRMESRGKTRHCRPCSARLTVSHDHTSQVASLCDAGSRVDVLHNPGIEAPVILAENDLSALAMSQLLRSRKMSIDAHGYSAYLPRPDHDHKHDPTHKHDHNRHHRLGTSTLVSNYPFARDVQQLRQKNRLRGETAAITPSVSAHADASVMKKSSLPAIDDSVVIQASSDIADFERRMGSAVLSVPSYIGDF